MKMLFGNFLTEKRIILLFVLAFAVVYLLFFPKIYVSGDEYGYLKNAFLLQKGNLKISEPEFAFEAHQVEDSYVIGRFIGKSIFLIPFTWFGLNGIMISGLFIHLLNLLLIFLILKKMNYNRLLSLVYLFIPVLAWESRTLYVELLVLTFLLAAFYYYISANNKRQWFLSGAFFGLAMLVRYDAGAAFAGFLLASIIKKQRKALFLLAGFLPMMAFCVLLNKSLYGNFLSTGYGANNTIVSLILSIFTGFNIETVIIAVAVLLVGYPLLLASPFLNKKFEFKLEFLFLAIAYVLLNAKFTNFLAFDFSIIGYLSYRLRYLVPLIGLLVIPYASLLDSLLAKISNKLNFNKMALIFTIFLILFLGAILLNFVRGMFLTDRFAVLQQLQKNIPQGSLVIGSTDDCMYFMTELFGNYKCLNIDLEGTLGDKFNNENIYNFIEKRLNEKNKVFIVLLEYSNRMGSESTRQNVIDRGVNMLKEFINKNKGKLKLVFETDKPHFLRIYEYMVKDINI